MSEFNKLVSEIEKALHDNSHVIVAISGFGGAGKSYLTDQLRDYFKIKDNQVVRIDHLYGPNPDGPDIFDQSDWDLIQRILKDVRAGKRLQYQGKSYEGDILHFDAELPRVVIFEGVRLLQPRLMPYFDISVWIDCPQDFAIQRAKARDRQQGEGEETVSKWDTDWGPKDKAYFDRYHPEKLASFIYKEYTFF